MNFFTTGKFYMSNEENRGGMQGKRLRPISLTTWTYKLIAKVLAERLKKIMPSIRLYRAKNEVGV